MLLGFILIVTIVAFGLLIADIVTTSVALTICLCIAIWLSFFGWIYIGYMSIHRKRLFLFSIAMLGLNRSLPTYHALFVIYDFIKDDENNLEVVRQAMESIYFFPSKVIKHPEKVKKKELYNLLIEYYLSLPTERLKITFFWDYNRNFYTWKWVAILVLFGAAGIIGLMLSYHTIPNPNDVLYTCLYFFFGFFTLPFIAKIFGHFI